CKHTFLDKWRKTAYTCKEKKVEGSTIDLATNGLPTIDDPTALLSAQASLFFLLAWAWAVSQGGHSYAAEPRAAFSPASAPASPFDVSLAGRASAQSLRIWFAQQHGYGARRAQACP